MAYREQSDVFAALTVTMERFVESEAPGMDANKWSANWFTGTYDMEVEKSSKKLGHAALQERKR